MSIIPYFVGILIIITLLPTGCTNSTTSNNITIIQARTIIPKKNPITFSEIKSKALFPEHILNIGTINRPLAEFREGPGIQFKLRDRLLKRDDKVLILDRLGVWQKVFYIKENSTGWVHNKTIKKVSEKRAYISLDIHKLPKIFAIKEIKTAWEYDTNRKLSISIPKGTPLIYLKQKRHKNLVIINNTKSVIWVPKRSVQ